MSFQLLAVLRDARKRRARKRASSTTHRRRFSLEPLESRVLLDSYGFGRANAPELTISFAPDGTSIAGHESSLFAEMDAIAPANDWQQTIVRAFQTWAQHVDADVTVVSDSGAPFGVSGPTQGDPRFGDIRIGAVPMASGVVGISVPHNQIVSGTWAGDILFSTDADFGSLEELFSVALHEAGHGYGLDHSNDPNSPMFSHLQGSIMLSDGISLAAQPTARDIAALKSLYRLPQPKGEMESQDLDDKLETANPLVVSANFDYAIRFYATGRIAGAEDVDYFRLDRVDSAFEHFRHLSVTVRSTAPDAVVPRATIFNYDGEEVESVILANGNGVFTIEAKAADPRRSHFIRIESDAVDPTFGGAGYALTATFGSQATTFEKAAKGSFDKERTSTESTFDVRKTGLFHFALTVDSEAGESGIVTRANILDANGTSVFHVAAQLGETKSANTVLLTPGEYRIDLDVEDLDGGEIPQLKYSFMYGAISIPVGPRPIDPINLPILDPIAWPIDAVVVDPIFDPIVDLPAVPPADPPVSPPVDPAVTPLVDPLAGSPADPFVDPLVDPLVEAILEPVVEPLLKGPASNPFGF